LILEEVVIAKALLIYVTVTNHATNVTQVGVVVSAHVVVLLGVTNYETKLKVKVYGSKLWYVLDRDSCLPG
jgi:negative regulator of sigma E activity